MSERIYHPTDFRNVMEIEKGSAAWEELQWALENGSFIRLALAKPDEDGHSDALCVSVDYETWSPQLTGYLLP